MIMSYYDIIMSRVGLDNRLRKHRELRSLSQVELAARAGLSRSEISAIETGRVCPVMLP